MPIEVTVNNNYSLSHHDCTPLSQKRFITFLFLAGISAVKVFHLDMKGGGGKEEAKSVKRSQEGKIKQRIRRESLCLLKRMCVHVCVCI